MDYIYNVKNLGLWVCCIGYRSFCLGDNWIDIEMSEVLVGF